MSERLSFSIADWQKEQKKFGYSGLISEDELKRLNELCKLHAEGWTPIKPLKHIVEVINLHLPRFTQIKEYPTRL